MCEHKLRSITAMVVISAAIAVSGCGDQRSKEINTTDILNTVDDSGNLNVLNKEKASKSKANSATTDTGDEFADLSEELLNSVPDIEKMSQDDLFAMSIDEFRAFIATYSPKYRAVYKIKNDTVMTDEDWESLRHLVSYNMFGSLWYRPPVSVSDNTMTEAVYEITEEDTEMIEELDEVIEQITYSSTEEFIGFLAILLEDEDTADDLTDLTDEEITLLKEEILAVLVEERESLKNGSISSIDESSGIVQED